MGTAELTLTTPMVRLARLVECVCAEVSSVKPLCYCGPFFGGDTPVDYCTECDGGACGQAWVRLVQAYPSSAFPEPDQTADCSRPLAYEWEVGVARCAPTLDEGGTAPTREENLDATIQQYADMEAMRRAIRCCFGPDDRGLETDYVLALYTPLPVLGGCNVATWQVFSR